MDLHHIQWLGYSANRQNCKPLTFGSVIVRGPNYSRCFYGDYWRSSLLTLPRFGCFE